MELYHCSPTGGITVLEPLNTKFSEKPRQVCLTASLPMALMYGVRNYEYTYGYTKEGRIYYQEYFPDAAELLYGGKSAWLYRCELQPDMERTRIPNEYVSARPVAVTGAQFIPDVYRALLEMNNVGMSSAASVFQAVLGFILVMVSNTIVKLVDEDSALF